MKKDTHPEFFDQATVTCVCGNSFTVGATKEKINVEICSDCHPFYTGKEKLIDTAGRIEKFQKKIERRLKTPAKKSRKKSEKKSTKVL